jgi:hypothetical protein
MNFTPKLKPKLDSSKCLQILTEGLKCPNNIIVKIWALLSMYLNYYKINKQL